MSSRSSESSCVDDAVDRVDSRQRSVSCPAAPSSSPSKIIFALVGLPARGKSFLSVKIVSFLTWLGIPARIFNAGNKRRSVEGAVKSGRSEFFANTNRSAVSKRDQIALDTLDDALQWLVEENGLVAMFDATNTTIARRKLIQAHIEQCGVVTNLIFLESICDNEDVLHNNLLQKVRNSPDFSGLDEASALNDLKARIKAYEQVYEPVSDDEEVSYIKVINLASKVICNQIYGTIPIRCVQLLMSCHVGHRPVFLVRAGHCNGVDDLGTFRGAAPGQPVPCTRGVSDAVLGFPSANTNDMPGMESVLGPYASYGQNLDTKRGFTSPTAAASSTSTRVTWDTMYTHGQNLHMPSSFTCNAHLSDRGISFSMRLGKFMEKYPTAVPFTSTLPRAIETAYYLPNRPNSNQSWSALGILDTGICHGMSVSDIREKMPVEYSDWERDPFHFRFPGGESLVDMNRRLAEVVLEVERVREPVVVVSHLSTIQSLVAYFTGQDPCNIPHIRVPQHSILELKPSIYGWTMQTIEENMLPEL
mmetsp:Transcript_7175/g.10671  ORF Transcript_7175/g.10671 Transcript_7175/m.10671 type:complete len:532 (+) Transcript_7175:22-1617(+)